MTLLIDKRCDIVFLSQHPMGSQLTDKAVAKVVKCATSTVPHWLNRWKESMELSVMKRSRKSRAVTEKVDQRISELADSDCIATTGDTQDVSKQQNVRISQETIRRKLEEVEVKFSRSTSKPLLTENHGYKRLQ